MKRTENESIKLIALGGVGELGKNMYVVEVDEDLFVIDAGLMFPENEMFGIDIVIPDISYLVQNQSRVKGIFLTHGHEDHIGALSYLLSKMDVPIYGTRLTIALAQVKMKEQDFHQKAQFIEISSDSVIEFDSAKVTFFKTNHSIPDSVAICIHTSEGIIVHTGDFKFDQTAGKLYKPEIGKMVKIGEEGVLCLLSDSTDAEKPGYTRSEAVVARELNDAFYNASGRVIAACFASDLNRIQHIFDAAYGTNRKVAIVGKSLQRVFDIVIKLEYLQVHDEIIIPVSEINQYPANEIVILTTGSQGEPIEVLQKMAKQTHKFVNIQKGDTVVFAVSAIKGNEIFIARTVDMLFRAGANVLGGKNSYHTSSHGSQEELKFMINLMNLVIRMAHRLLEVHVLAGVQRLERLLRMPVIGGRDDNGIDVLARDHFVIVQVGVALEALACALLALLIHIRYGHNLARIVVLTGVLRERLADVIAASAGADEADLDPVVCAQHSGAALGSMRREGRFGHSERQTSRPGAFQEISAVQGIRHANPRSPATAWGSNNGG